MIEAESFGFRFDEADLFVVDALDDLLVLAEAPKRRNVFLSETASTRLRTVRVPSSEIAWVMLLISLGKP